VRQPAEQNPGPARDSGEASSATAVRITVDLLAFASELAMLVLLAVAGWDIGHGGLMGIALAVLYPALTILIWSAWIAPRAPRRLADPWRLVVQLALFAGTGVAVGVGGHVAAAIVFSVVASLAFIASRFVAGTSNANPTHR
jgi:hypothetical protein